jgi:hypothetical protein
VVILWPGWHDSWTAHLPFPCGCGIQHIGKWSCNRTSILSYHKTAATVFQMGIPTVKRNRAALATLGLPALHTQASIVSAQKVSVTFLYATLCYPEAHINLWNN